MPVLDFDKFKSDFSLHNHRPRVFSWPILGTLIISAGLFILYKLNQYVTIWDSWREALGNATNFCEMNRYDQLIVQPSNTWSNIGFIIVGLIFIGIARNDHHYSERHSVKNLLAKYPGFSALIGLSALYMGIGSFLFHATLTRVFQKLDQTGMYFLVISFLAYTLFKLFPVIKFRGKLHASNKFFITCAVILQLLFFFYLWKLPLNIVFPSMTTAVFLLNFFIIKRMKKNIGLVGLLKASVITLLISSSVWILDITDKLCSPTSIWQGHSLWHILNAMSIFLAYLYYRSEIFQNEQEEESENINGQLA